MHKGVSVDIEGSLQSQEAEDHQDDPEAGDI